MNSFLRWAGSKRQLIPKLKQFWLGGKTRYVEPFCGSACLFFALQPHEAVLGDLNSELTDTYRALQDNPTAVLKGFSAMRRSKETYYAVRKQNPDELRKPERAARFLYLNRHCFNGIYRTNAAGQFNVPYGPQKHNTPIDEAALLQAATLLNRAKIVTADFSGTMKHLQAGDFVYLDPPYAVQQRRVFREYHPDSFATEDLAILAAWLHEIHERGAYFVISYCDSREARELLRPWRPQRVRTRRNIAGFASHRRHAYELLATNMRN